jgi:hypothetical protein
MTRPDVEGIKTRTARPMGLAISADLNDLLTYVAELEAAIEDVCGECLRLEECGLRPSTRLCPVYPYRKAKP